MPNTHDADEAYSLCVRLRSCDRNGYVTCITCGARGHYKDFDCSHFVPRGNQATRFDDRNTGPACRFCNRVQGGELEKFAVYIDSTYGPGTADALRVLGRSVCKRTKAEINEMAQHYRKEVARLKKEKGL